MDMRCFALISLFTLAACATDPKPVAWMPVGEPAELKAPGAQWIKAQAAAGRRLLAAVFRPQGSGPFPVVVVLHGASGLQQDHLVLAAELAREGFIGVAGCWQFIASPPAAAPNPVCAEAPPQAAWQADPAAHSGKELIAAVRTLRGARPDRIGLYGLSRGGNAALWAASTGAAVQAIVVDAPADHPAARVVPPPPGTQTAVKGLSAPTLMLHGTADRVVPVEQSREYDKAARELGKPLTALYYDGMGHMVTFAPAGKESAELAEARRVVQPQARQRAIAFLREQLTR